MKTTMIKFTASVLTIFVTALYSLTSSAQQQYRENVYVFSPDFTSWVPADEECAAAVARIGWKHNIKGINPNNNGRLTIYSVGTSLKNGKVTNLVGEQIGNMLLCQDFQTHLPEGGEFPTDSPSLVPVYYEITIGTRTFRVAGGGTALESAGDATLSGGGEDHAFNFPNPMRSLSVFSATVLPSVPGMRGGVYMDSRLNGPMRDVGDGLTANLIQVLRVQLPVKP